MKSSGVGDQCEITHYFRRSSYPDFEPGSHTSSDDDDDDLSVVPVGDVLRDSTEEDMELVLPSGARVGHRSLMRWVCRGMKLTCNLVRAV